MHRPVALTFAKSLLLLALLLAFSPVVRSQNPFSSVQMDLTLSREGTEWKAATKFNAGGQEFLPTVEKLSVNGTNITFSTVIEGTEVRFTGTLVDGKLGGTLEALEKGKRIATGTWKLVPAEPGGATADFARRWTGKFSAQIIPPQQADSNFDTKVGNPAYTKNHPRVLFDEAHNNIHTTDGLYKPFADLVTNDGYAVTPNKEKFTPQSLGNYEVLVIANAAGPRGHRADPAFTDEEADTVRAWVDAGGSLLFISDHAPMGAAAEILAQRFAVNMSKAYTDDASSKDRVLGDILFSRENKLLVDYPITRGRNAQERVNRVVTFTGQSLKGPPGSIEFLKLPNTAVDRTPGTKDSTSAAGRSQGVSMKFGRGRVVVLGEAGMLTAQIDDEGRVFGMNYPNIDNRQLALNIMHWLSRLLN